MTSAYFKTSFDIRSDLERGRYPQLLALVGTWRARARQRRDLAALTAEQLADVGITVAAARAESSKPFWME